MNDLQKWTTNDLIIEKNRLIDIIIDSAKKLEAIKEELSE